MHYPSKIEYFTSPNGVCSSITESTHITVVKKPWQCSNHNNPLLQMMQTISQLYKLNALHKVYNNCGMLDGKLSDYASALISGNPPTIHNYGAQKNGVNTDGHDEDDDGGLSAAACANAQVTLALTQGEFLLD
jgi:hypothetical protein